ncbi:hypothetical protein MTBBW1_2300022 [Desulfamplus magnetovallimortis]|uniref:Uncharacterized protein n=1 Tax=Desulfamplus magnetovallimortis TaxID=1246637 RepID=A0A1W1HDJ8_9BACT|nr:hypothetical protein [Desulfamplus magnetovallimortis]SLM30550.1 hypothetical protein MTBBW1_2300022 [Desulfamplus magnetovallimortis]
MPEKQQYDGLDMEIALGQWRYVNSGGLEEMLIPIHVETIQMLIEIDRAVHGERENPNTPRILIEAMIHYRHHTLFHADVPINSAEDAGNHMANMMNRKD